jgi:hypothetical protein
LLSSLSAPELDTVCRWLAQEADEGVTSDIDCLPGAVYRTSTKASCEAVVDWCEADYPERRAEALGSMLAKCEEYVIEAECKATVAQFETCVGDRLRLLRAFGNSLSCDKPIPGGSVTDGQLEPASCDALSRGCFP